MNFTADLRSTQANNIGFYFASRICSLSADFSVSTFPFQRPSQISKQHLHFFNTNQATDYISSDSKPLHSLCLSPPPTFLFKWKEFWFPTFNIDFFFGVIKMQNIDLDAEQNWRRD